ncbi:MAG TPA: HAD family hydrolase [Mucilaginibacter sp.]|nr:HAD family hydrolase [Mucilaginibacter sp.]
MKKALILDLDNTIYPVSSISENLFGDLFTVLDQHAMIINATDADTVNKIKDEMTRRPFQHIADEFNLDTAIRNKMVDMLRNMAYSQPMTPFDDYHHVRNISLDKFLVTTGFSKLQWSKVSMLGIENDFKHIHIVDPDVSRKTKKDIFAEIMETYNYVPADLLVIGDDPQSEIKAAQALGIETVLYDPGNKYPTKISTYKIDSMKAVPGILAE